MHTCRRILQVGNLAAQGSASAYPRWAVHWWCVLRGHAYVAPGRRVRHVAWLGRRAPAPCDRCWRMRERAGTNHMHTACRPDAPLIGRAAARPAHARARQRSPQPSGRGCCLCRRAPRRRARRRRTRRTSPLWRSLRIRSGWRRCVCVGGGALCVCGGGGACVCVCAAAQAPCARAPRFTCPRALPPHRTHSATCPMTGQHSWRTCLTPGETPCVEVYTLLRTVFTHVCVRARWARCPKCHLSLN